MTSDSDQCANFDMPNIVHWRSLNEKKKNFILTIDYKTQNAMKSKKRRKKQL